MTCCVTSFFHAANLLIKKPKKKGRECLEDQEGRPISRVRTSPMIQRLQGPSFCLGLTAGVCV